MTQTELSKKTKISRQSIINIELGHSGMSIKTAFRIARALNIEALPVNPNVS